MAMHDSDASQPKAADDPTPEHIRAILLRLIDLLARRLAQELSDTEQRDRISEQE
jgi:hypothetical protein